jgi:hypothetical protein
MAVIIGIAPMVSAASANDLAAYRWKNRILLVFSPTASDHSFKAFNQRLSERHIDVLDRDLIVYRILEKGHSRLDEQTLAPEEANKLRRDFGPKPGRFTVILVGKDGGVKMFREERTDLQEIFDLIDSMPMRQQEMHEKSKSR